MNLNSQTNGIVTSIPAYSTGMMGACAEDDMPKTLARTGLASSKRNLFFHISLTTAVMVAAAGEISPSTIQASARTEAASFDLYSSSEHVRNWQKDTLLKRIDQFSHRSIGWDGDDGLPPNIDAINDAKTFLIALGKNYALPDSVHAVGDGEIVFQWRRRYGVFVEVGFYGDETISWYAKLANLPADHNDSRFTRDKIIPIDHGLDAALKTLT